MKSSLDRHERSTDCPEKPIGKTDGDSRARGGPAILAVPAAGIGEAERIRSNGNRGKGKKPVLRQHRAGHRCFGSPKGDPGTAGSHRVAGLRTDLGNLHPLAIRPYHGISFRGTKTPVTCTVLAKHRLLAFATVTVRSDSLGSANAGCRHSKNCRAAAGATVPIRFTNRLFRTIRRSL